MATSPNRSRVACSASLATLVMVWLCLSPAWAGAPATLDDGGSVNPKPAAADTSKKSTKKTTTASAPPKSAGAVAKAPTKAATPAPPSGGTKPAAGKPATLAKAAPPSKTATTPNTTAPRVAKSGAAVPTGIARVAPPPSGTTTAKIPTGSKAPLAPSGIARIPAPPGGKNAPTQTASVTRLTPTTPTSVKNGPTLAKSGGTTVTGPSVTPIKPGSGKAGAALGAGVASKPTPGTKAGSPLAVKGGATVSAALEDHVTYQYNALGRRDPFQSLMEGEYVGAEDQAPPDLGGLKLVGVVWGSSDQFAMVEDVKGGSYVLRRGDRVMNGFVEGLKRDAIIVNITVDGQSQSVTIPITRKGDKSNANR